MCFIQWVRAKLLSIVQPKGSSPLPMAILSALFISMFGNAVAMQMLFAFLPDMVKSFGISDEDAGYYVGVLASAVFFGRFISSYFWGWLSDKIGRRKVLLMCNGSLAVMILAFGFSKSFEAALLIRFVTGLIAGIAGTVKASLAEVCDDSNQALGMSVVVTAWNTGMIIGPAVGGYLAKPAAKYTIFKNNSFFERYAYLLPCLINATVNVLSFLMVFFVLPETLASKRKKKDLEMLPVSVLHRERTELPADSSPLNRQRSTVKTNQGIISNGHPIPKSNAAASEIQNSPKLSKSSELLSGSVSFLPEVEFQTFLQVTGSVNDVNNVNDEPYVIPAGKSKPGFVRKTSKAMLHSKLVKLVKNKDVRYTVAVYTVFSFAVVAEHEVYSVWAATGKDLGGLGFDTNDLGFTLMVTGIGCSVSNCIVFPQLVERFGLMNTQFITLIVTMFFVIIMPTTNILLGRGTILMVTVTIFLLFIRIGTGCSFTGQFIFIGNCVSSNLRATVHGFAMTMTCAARSISPMIAGSIYSWSITSGLGFPFNEKCVYIFLGFVLWLSLVIACCLDKETVTTNKQSTK